MKTTRETAIELITSHKPIDTYTDGDGDPCFDWEVGDIAGLWTKISTQGKLYWICCTDHHFSKGVLLLTDVHGIDDMLKRCLKKLCIAAPGLHSGNAKAL